MQGRLDNLTSNHRSAVQPLQFILSCMSQLQNLRGHGLFFAISKQTGTVSVTLRFNKEIFNNAQRNPSTKMGIFVAAGKSQAGQEAIF